MFGIRGMFCSTYRTRWMLSSLCGKTSNSRNYTLETTFQKTILPVSVSNSYFIKQINRVFLMINWFPKKGKVYNSFTADFVWSFLPAVNVIVNIKRLLLIVNKNVGLAESNLITGIRQLLYQYNSDMTWIIPFKKHLAMKPRFFIQSLARNLTTYITYCETSNSGPSRNR